MATFAEQVAQQWSAWDALPAAATGLSARAGQREMSVAVAEAIEARQALLVEAGTGTGKSLAYLVPAVLSGKRVVIATATKALQDQLVARELPRLWQLGLTPVPHQVLKGVANYVCQRRFALAAMQRHGDQAARVDDVRAWHARTATGDIAEVSWRPPGDARWRDVTTTAEARLGAKCPFSATCFVTAARRQAERAKLIFVNHALYFADLSLRRRGSQTARVVPDHDIVIFDEAHGLEAVATEHFTRRLFAPEVFEFLRRAVVDATPNLFSNAGGQGAAGALPHLAHAEAAFRELFAAYGTRLAQVPQGGGGERASRRDDADRLELPAGFMAAHAVQAAYFALDTALDQFVRWSDNYVEAASAAGEPPHEAVLGAVRRAAQWRDDLALLHEQRDPGYVYWAQRDRGVMVGASPIDVRDVLGRHVVRQPQATPIFTSATFTVQQSFAFVRERWGLFADDARELLVPSPFDYGTQALLYIARDLPPPGLEAIGEAALRRLAELLAITDGHAFALFTSHRSLAAAAAWLRTQVDYPLLVQGEAPSPQLLDQFRAVPRSVLLGTGQFWEGVDVPGAALSHVIIDRLPFAPPSEPVAQARARLAEQRGEDPFTGQALPDAAIALRQGIGRLLRASDDCGLISVLDPRLVTKQYGRVFLESLPRELPRTAVIEQARRWWRDRPVAATAPSASPSDQASPPAPR